MTWSISVIIPTLDEEARLDACLARLSGEDLLETIVADGGSSDLTTAIARRAGTRVVTAPPGRGTQLNCGSRAATGEILLFLHADTILPPGFPALVREALSRPGIVAGAFSFALDAKSAGLTVVAAITNIRARLLQLPYGDQAIFVRKKMFDETGGFADIPAMEDFELVRRLRRRGKINILPQAAITSARRWQCHGILRTFLVNQGMVLGFYLKRSPVRLAAWYRRGGRFR